MIGGCLFRTTEDDGLMPAESPTTSELGSADPIGVRYPNTARIWNYQLGGKDNFAVDREASDAANAMVMGLGVPAGTDTAIESRHLLQRMVDYMLGQGVRQFLDLGSGLPNMANTHQIAHRVAPEARIVYADVDPMVSTHAAALMAGSNVVTLRADLREPEQVLGDARVRDLLDFGQPIGIMFMCVLHCLWDKEDPWNVVRQFRDAVSPGSSSVAGTVSGTTVTVRGRDLPLVDQSTPPGPATALVRPEAVTLASQGADESGPLTGTVIAVTFLGATSRVTVDLGDTTILAQLSTSDASALPAAVASR